MNLSNVWKRWQRKLAAPSRSTKRARSIETSVEVMEPRQLLSASTLFLPATGELSIELDSTDSVRITSVAGTLSVSASTAGGPYLPVNSIGSVPASSVISINVLGGDDANTIDMSGVTAAAFTSLTSIVADGGNGDDLIIGSPDFSDSLIGGNGNDTIQGNGGNDTIAGGDGSDLISGGTGNDSITAGDGNDSVTGDDGNDTITAGNGQDTVSGGNGNDNINGQNGQDSINGDAGDDTLNGDGGTDTVNGGDGNDSIFGGELNDSLFGGNGNDTIDAGAGNDTVDGGLGDDNLQGEQGNDSLLGNGGNDVLNGGVGKDTADGGTGNDTIFGGAGNDVLFGNVGDDNLYGQAGNDTIQGGDGADLLNGGAGNDLELADDVLVSVVPTFSATEGTGGTTVIQIVLALSQPTFGATSIDFTTVAGTALAGQDFIATSGTVTFAPGQQSQIVSVTVVADNIDENNETFSLVLSNPQNLTIDNGTSLVTIVDDDTAAISINDVSVIEGGIASAGTAIQPGFNANTLAANDDNSTAQVPIGFTINFFGTQYANLYVNNNGNVTFTGPLGAFTPFPILTTATPIIAPFFADVDTRAASSQPVTYGTGAVGGHAAFGVNWIDVGHFTQGVPLNRFQLILIDRSDVGVGDFDIEFNYDQILWEAGTASGGNAQGLGGSSARVGYSNGTTTAFELPGSAVNGALLDGGPAATSLIRNSIGSSILGQYLFGARNGGVSAASGNQMVFTVSLDTPSANPISVNYNTADITATANPGPGSTADYTAQVGTLTFAPGVTTQTITVPIRADVAVEPDETFAVNLSNPVNSVISDGQGIGTIINDDGVPTPVLPPPTTPPTPPPLPNNTVVVTTPTPTFAGNSVGFANTLLGSDGNDTLFGGSGDETLNGQGGDDLIFAGGGNDAVFGGSGNDTLDGQAGDDTLDGQGGNDSLIGGDGNDTFVLGNNAGGSDTVDGNEGFNQIVANGTNNADTLVVGQNSGRIKVTRGNATITALSNMSVQGVTVNALAGNDTITINDLSSVSCAVLVVVNGGDGNDKITGQGSNLGLVRLALNGNNGNDTIIGTNGGDSIDGGAGDDAINGQAGNDSMVGGDGNDTLVGGLGNDSVDGQAGNDSINGSAGDDSLIGGLGDDSIKGDVGNDTLVGLDGDDLLNGMAGDDSISGGVGQDQISGGSGNDTLDGGRNDDTINGNDGNDKIFGDHGNDLIDAGIGNDTVSGGDGNDTITATDGNDLLAGNDGNDHINAGGGKDTLLGNDGNDTLLGGGGDDVILGGDGDDYINGQGGTNTVAGNQGIDTIVDPPSQRNEHYVLPDSVLAQFNV